MNLFNVPYLLTGSSLFFFKKKSWKNGFKPSYFSWRFNSCEIFYWGWCWFSLYFKVNKTNKFFSEALTKLLYNFFRDRAVKEIQRNYSCLELKKYGNHWQFKEISIGRFAEWPCSNICCLDKKRQTKPVNFLFKNKSVKFDFRFKWIRL